MSIQAHVLGEAPNKFKDPVEAVKTLRVSAAYLECPKFSPYTICCAGSWVRLVHQTKFKSSFLSLRICNSEVRSIGFRVGCLCEL